MQQQIKYGTDEYGNIWHDFAQIEPVGGTVCYNPRSETLDEPITPDEGRRLIIENGHWTQIAISVEHIKDGDRIRPKTQIERYATGVDVIPKGMKLVTAVDGTKTLETKTTDERLSSGEITQSEYNEIVNAPIKKELADIDVKSVRAIREWLIKQSDCPEFLKTYESQAVTKRAGLKK